MSRAAVAPRILDPHILSDRAREAVAQLRVTDLRLSDMLEPYLQAHSAWPNGRSYRLPSPAVQAITSGIAAQWGAANAAAFQKAALLEGLRRTRSALLSHDRWPHSLPYFDDNVVRTLPVLEGCADEDVTYANDNFAKNMALATGRMWHARAALVEPRLGIARRSVYSASIATAVRAVGLSWRIGGFFPMYEIHNYDRLLQWFSAEAWADCYRMIAQALARDPQARGVYGAAWFFDPELASVSPGLEYLYRFPSERGALFLKVRTSDHDVQLALMQSGATPRHQTSDLARIARGAALSAASRRKMFEQGTYRPQKYLLIWTRRSMLRWLASGAA